MLASAAAAICARDGVVRALHFGGRQRLEADEDVRQTRGVEQAAELAGDFGDGREDGRERSDRDRPLGDLGQARQRTDGDDAAERAR